MMRAFSRVRPAQDALKEYRQSIKKLLTDNQILYCLSKSRDKQRTKGTNAEYVDAIIQSIKSLDKEVKEPDEVFFLLEEFTNVQ